MRVFHKPRHEPVRVDPQKARVLAMAVSAGMDAAAAAEASGRLDLGVGEAAFNTWWAGAFGHIQAGDQERLADVRDGARRAFLEPFGGSR